MPITINGNGTVTGLSSVDLPAGTVTTEDIASAAVTPAKLSQPLTRVASQTASGLNVDFTGIPSWVRRITVMFDGISLNGNTDNLIQIGDSGGFEVTGYVSSSNFLNGGVQSGSAFSVGGFSLLNGSLNNVITGSVVIVNISGNTWIATGLYNLENATGYTLMTAGKKTLSDTLTQVRITTVNGTSTFDAGSINIMYEG